MKEIIQEGEQSNMRGIKICKCEVCGNIVLLLQDSNNPLTCCNKQMKILQPNTTDAASEKHVPFLKSKVKDCKLMDTAIYEVQIGQTEHPMIPEHYIN
jgi:superoxide reductase